MFSISLLQMKLVSYKCASAQKIENNEFFTYKKSDVLLIICNPGP